MMLSAKWPGHSTLPSEDQWLSRALRPSGAGIYIRNRPRWRMDRIEEATLLERLRQGDEAAYELLIRTYGGRLLAVARGLLRNEEDARDVVQSAYISAFRGLETFKG